MVSMARDDTRSSSTRVGAGLSALAVVVALLQGCATALDTTVTAFHQAEVSWVGKRFAIVPDGSQRDSLEFQSYAALVSQGLQKNGLVPAGSAAGAMADVDVRLQYKAQELRPLSYSTPYYGYGAFGPMWGPYPYYYGTYYARAPYWPMGYGIAGAETREYRNWRRELKVDIGKPGESGRQFEATAISDGAQASLVQVMPALVEAIFHDFPGPNGQVRHVPVELREPAKGDAARGDAATGDAAGSPAAGSPAAGQSRNTQLPSR